MSETVDGLRGDPCLPMPTLKGKVAGIVGWEPVVLQCSDCGATLTQPEGRSVATFILTAGWWFHICEGRKGKRRCRECLALVKAGCPNARCNGDVTAWRSHSKPRRVETTQLLARLDGEPTHDRERQEA